MPNHKFKFSFNQLYATAIILGLLLLGFTSCHTKPKSKYGPPSDYRSSEKIR